MTLNLNIEEYLPKQRDGEAGGGGDPKNIDFDLTKYIPKETRAKANPSPIKLDFSNPQIAPGQGNVTLGDNGFSQQGTLDENSDFNTKVITDVPEGLPNAPVYKNNIVKDLTDALPKLEEPSHTGNLTIDLPMQEMQKLNYVGQTLGTLFSIPDAIIKNIPGYEKEGRDFSQVINTPMMGLHLGYQELKKGTQNLLDYLGVPKNIQNLGLDDKQVQPIVKSLDDFNELAIQYGVPGMIHPILKGIKSKVEILPDELKTPDNISTVVTNEVDAFKEKRDKVLQEIQEANATKGKNMYPELKGTDIPFTEAMKYKKPYKVFDYDFTESGKTTPADIQGFKKLQDIEGEVQSSVGAQVPVDMNIFKDVKIDPLFNEKENKTYKRLQDLKETSQKYNEGGFFDIPKNWQDRTSYVEPEKVAPDIKTEPDKVAMNNQRIAELKSKIQANNSKYGLQSSIIGGLNPENVPHYLELGKLHFDNGLIKFTDWSKQMLDDLGEHVKPYLQDYWKQITEAPEEVKPTPSKSPEVQLDNIFATDQKYVKALQEFKDAPLSERVSMAKEKYFNDVKEIPSELYSGIKKGLLQLRDTGKVLLHQYLNPPVENSLNVATREWTGGRNIISQSVDQMQNKVKSVVPDALTDRAINAYIEANGDMQQLQEWRDLAKEKVNQKKYDRAMKLTDKQKNVADFIREVYKEKAKDGLESGLITHTVENFVNHKWKKQNPVTQGLMNDFNYGTGLKTNLESAMKRIFKSNFEGEQLGYKSVSDKISDNIAMYMQSFDHVANDRYYIKKLIDGKASDGRPAVGVNGVGIPIKDTDGITQATLIKPNANPQAISDYRSVNVPALKDWKIIANDRNGKPILLQGDLVVHPEYAAKLKNALRWGTKEGKIDVPVYNQVKWMQQQAKGMIFFVNPFHAVQEGVHTIFHEVNPLKMTDFDPSNPMHKRAVNSGLMVTDYDAMESISEGLAMTKLAEKFPIAGQIGSEIKDFTFKKQIPSYKLNVWEAMRDKNEKIYGKKYSPWQLDALTSDQVNVAFGHLNYRAMFRNPIVQEVFRFVTIAPDFLESRVKFTAQALKPTGLNQLRALMVGTAGLYTLSRTINYLINGQTYADDLSMAFSVKVGDRTYDLRSVPGDIIEAVTDPRRFVSNRLSPMGKFGEELLTGKDWQGRPMSFTEAGKDLLMTYIPSMVRGRQDMNIGQSILSNFGLRNKQYKTAIEKDINEQYWKYFPPGALTDKQKEKSEIFNEIRNLKMKGDLKGAQELFTKGVDEKVISEKKDYDDFLKDIDEGLYMNRFKLLPPEAQTKLWDKMDLIEREKYQPLLSKDAKVKTGTENTKDKYNDLQDELHRLQTEWSTLIDKDGNVLPESKSKADAIANRYRQVNEDIAKFKNTQEYQQQKVETNLHRKELKTQKETIQNYK